MKRVQSSTVEYKSDLIINHISLVKKMAKKVLETLPSNMELDDLIEAGIFGLIDAAEKFDSARQKEFSKYAKFRIRGAMIDGLREMDFISRSKRRKIKRMENATFALEQRFGRAVTDSEVANELEIDMDEYYKTQQDTNNSKKIYIEDIDEKIGDTEDDETVNGIYSDNYEKRLLDGIANRELREIIFESLKILPEKQKQVMLLYYWDDCNMKEVGDIMGIAESTVSSHHNDALEKLKNSLKDKKAVLMFSLNS